MLQGIMLQNWNYAAELELCCNLNFKKSYAAELELCCKLELCCSVFKNKSCSVIPAPNSNPQRNSRSVIPTPVLLVPWSALFEQNCFCKILPLY